MKFLTFLSEAIVPLIFFYIVAFGLISGRPVFEDFLEGAKEGMITVAGILPTLVGLSVSVGVLRALGLPSQIVPVLFVRLVSNSAATGLVLDLFKEYGTDSTVGLMASILMSSTETVLYCLSVYFGSAGITKTRYALAGGLIATAAGAAASVFLAMAM